MKTNKKYDAVLDVVRAELNAYYFKIKDTKVKVVFSNKPDAPTIENALVKIGTKRLG